MAKSGRGVERQASHESTGAAQPGEDAGDPFEEWERYPATEAEENIGYQKVA